ncbi:PTS sugar transporter subunit IIA [Carnobacterium gallinarum]|uniref:PTS sugar transporter subunit IIA n=1 Tax=Carnobacterium gallinarum TaxID=2749 RepID=UPI00054F4EB1|nr:hypothetical protein [Carnobacterium gallinarum]
MIGIVVTSHGLMSAGMVDSLEMIAGKNQHVYSIALDNEGIENYQQRLVQLLDQLNQQYKQILICCDLKGGTPFNECYRYLLEHEVSMHLVTGVNLPMLIEVSLAAQFEENLIRLAAVAVEAGRESVILLDMAEETDNELDL